MEPAASVPTSVGELTDRLVRVAAGDRSAFADLYRATSRKLFGIVLRVLYDRELAEEVLQEIYVDIWEKASRFDASRASPITWMATIARNRAIDRRRRRQLDVVRDPPDLSTFADPGAAAPEQLEMTEEFQRLQACIDSLEGERGAAVRMAYLDGYSRQELATRLGLPIGTVKSWLHRSLKQLKDCLDA